LLSQNWWRESSTFFRSKCGSKKRRKKLLSKLDTDSEAVFRAMEAHQGLSYANARRAEYGAVPIQQRAACVQQFASDFVQRNAPCTYQPLSLNFN
jgi:hypothetical protein